MRYGAELPHALGDAHRLGFDRLLFWGAALGSTVVAGFTLLQPITPRWLIAAYIVFFGIVPSTQFMTSNTLVYADMPSDKLSGAITLGGVLQQLTISLGVSLSAMFLGLISSRDHLAPVDFHQAFLLMGLIPLLALPGFWYLRPEDGIEISRHHRPET